MSSFNNTLIFFVFTILLIIKLIKSDCIKLGETFPCDNTQNIPCCRGLYCRLTAVKNINLYRCSKDKCNTDGMGCKSDNACCYGTKCKGGKCTKCAKVYESCDIGECCEGSCSITDNICI
ncbi:unnamed protein product [Meloidogyne enterolobii]|uniref:Uncharacterized protein n=1 Tax=Meloidogyne enterolobii TaxID=390850 RepID=A0ACB0ZT45_MELEN